MCHLPSRQLNTDVTQISNVIVCHPIKTLISGLALLKVNYSAILNDTCCLEVVSFSGARVTLVGFVKVYLKVKISLCFFQLVKHV